MNLSVIRSTALAHLIQPSKVRISPSILALDVLLFRWGSFPLLLGGRRAYSRAELLVRIRSGTHDMNFSLSSGSLALESKVPEY